MWHHTASSSTASAVADVGFMLSRNNPAYPTANLYISRDGEVWVMAAGATNTNGKGSGERSTSRGTVPVDSMNTYAVGVEIGNNGIGEPYSQATIDTAFTTSLTITNRLGLLPTDVIHHQGYAPDRKIDPATAGAVQGPWRPLSINGSGTWSLSDLKAECKRRAAPPPVVPVPKPEPDLAWIAAT
jgi:N-acetylmuramoyl-L-alanine amidase